MPMVIVRAAVTVSGTSLLSTTCTVKLLAPVVVGVPLMTPVVGLKVSPAGNVPLARLNFNAPVPPDAVSVAL